MSTPPEPTLQYQRVHFDVPIASYNDLSTFAPVLPGPEWYYLGPVATSNSVPDQHGLIVKAVDPTALKDIEEWKKVGPNNEPEPPPPFSTWRGVAPDGYIVLGDFFVRGNEAPNAKQTAGLKAIRKDLVHFLQPQRLIWTGRQPWSVVTLWDIVAVPLIYIATGAFVSNPDSSFGEAKVGVLPWNLTVAMAWCVLVI